jgi:tetratricopeptide (TPR) repeat protein
VLKSRASSDRSATPEMLPSCSFNLAEVPIVRQFFWLLLFLLVFAAPTVRAQNPRSAKDFVKRGLTRFTKGDLDGAVNDYTRAIEMDSRLADAHLNRGKAKRAKGDLDGAISDYEKAIEIDPRIAHNWNRDITTAYSNRGFIRSNQMDLDGAISDFNRAIKFNPEIADFYIKRGRALLVRGDMEAAIADFDKGIALDPGDPLAYADRGVARMHQGKEAEARKDFDKSLELNIDLKLLIDLHVMDIELQIREIQRQRAASQQKIA